MVAGGFSGIVSLLKQPDESVDPVITYWEYDNFRAWRISKEGRNEGRKGGKKL
jgi:heme-degrading monooxygenase HmoA